MKCVLVCNIYWNFYSFKLLFKGTVKQLQDLTGWRGHQVLYFGDHPYSDLADVTLEHGWRTGAIITELTVSNYSNLGNFRGGYVVFFSARNCYFKQSRIQEKRQLVANVNPTHWRPPRLWGPWRTTCLSQMDGWTW